MVVPEIVLQDVPASPGWTAEDRRHPCAHHANCLYRSRINSTHD